jgi:hypothetical protein
MLTSSASLINRARSWIELRRITFLSQTTEGSPMTSKSANDEKTDDDDDGNVTFEPQ